MIDNDRSRFKEITWDNQIPSERQELNAEDVFAGALRLGHRLHEVSFLRQGPKLKRSTALQSISIDLSFMYRYLWIHINSHVDSHPFTSIHYMLSDALIMLLRPSD